MGIALPDVRRRDSSSAHFQPRFQVPWKALETRDARRRTSVPEWPFALPRFGRDQNPESQFAENDRIHGDI